MKNNPKFSYTVYMKATPERIWAVITNPLLSQQYWGHKNISDWKEGSSWQHVANDNKSTVKLVGEVLKFNSKELILTWASPNNLEDKSRVTFKINAIKDAVYLSVTHDNFKDGSKMFKEIMTGWPQVLSNMKSFIETGKTYSNRYQ